jgi:hypothetical protein
MGQIIYEHQFPANTKAVRRRKLRLFTTWMIIASAISILLCIKEHFAQPH